MPCYICGRRSPGGKVHTQCMELGPDDSKERRARSLELREMTTRLIESVMESPIARARLGGLIEKH